MTSPIGKVFQLTQNCPTHDTKDKQWAVVVSYAQNTGRGRMEASASPITAS